jgi:membrane protein DedA with SNARE-associated domain
MSQINQILASYGGLILFITVFTEQSGLPVPAAPMLLAAGALAAGGRLSLFAAICWAAVAALAADAIWFYVGQHGKGRLFQLFPHLHAVRQRLVKGTQACSILRGAGALTAAKFLPLGTVVPLHAGALDIRFLRFLLVDGVCSVVYANAYVLPGFFLHDQLEQVVALLQRLGVSTLLLLLIFVGGYLSYEFLKRCRRKVSKSIPSGPTLSQASVLVVCLAPSQTSTEVTCAPDAQTQNQS